jgi:hypothetical protein
MTTTGRPLPMPRRQRQTALCKGSQSKRSNECPTSSVGSTHKEPSPPTATVGCREHDSGRWERAGRQAEGFIYSDPAPDMQVLGAPGAGLWPW